MKDKKSNVITHLLEKKCISLPSVILKNKAIEELEKSLEEPSSAKRFFMNMAENLNNHIKEDALIIFQTKVEEFKNLYKDYSISKEDEEIVKFLVREMKDIDPIELLFYTLQISGTLIYVSKILKEAYDKELSKNLSVFIYTNLYVTIYEAILHVVDRALLLIINKKDEWKKKNKDFINNRRDCITHATAGKISKVLKNLGLKVDNSIFGNKSEAKTFRDRIAHANIYYDEYEDKIVIGLERYDFNKFEELFIRLFFFLVKWIEFSLNIENFSKFKSIILSELKKLFSELSREFLRIERSGEKSKKYSMWYHNLNLIIETEKEKNKTNDS
ncbi:MAG: hypothetical protein QW714_01295 [Nanopusillaceae archaeon]